ncbi:MAG: amidohydrolase [Proteobacteria bacterium]|nr:amidohydrolase [Pseudomonadota bacterium]MBU2228093.1 amidohydrolase [Pseudomonadota bacterium]MBU2261408.1 amidohydrolase [Pseudomonadota bacterium]
MNIDIHTHCIPREFIDLVKRNPLKYQARIEHDSQGKEMIRHDQGYLYPLFPGFYDMDIRFREMDQRKIDMDVISVSPTLYYYWADAALAEEIARVCNDSVAKLAKGYPKRIKPCASVPLQDVAASVKELERVVDRYGIQMVTIGTSVEGRGLDDPDFLPFFKKAEELGVAVMFHPYYVGDRLNLGDYYLTNLIGNPLDTTICIARLAFGGVLEQCPRSRFIFVHGGGYIPYQRGRLQHGYHVRPEPKVRVKSTPPFTYYDRLFFDTITHWGPALTFLVESHGAEKILMGSDYPFDMADVDPVRTVKTFVRGEADQKKVLSLNAMSLFQAK